MPKPTPDFTMADFLADMRAKMPQFAEGEALTTKQMAAELGLSESTMRRRLAEWKAAGLVRVCRKQIEALNGRMMTVTAWVVVSPDGQENPV